MANPVAKLLSDERVHLGDGALQKIEGAVEKIKANGKDSLMVRIKIVGPFQSVFKTFFWLAMQDSLLVVAILTYY